MTHLVFLFCFYCVFAPTAIWEPFYSRLFMLNIGQNRTSIIENLEIKGEQRIESNQISLDSDFVTMFLFVTIWLSC